MHPKPENGPDKLRHIKTARTLEEINHAAKEGFRPLVKPVDPSPEVHDMVAVLQNMETGEILLSGDCRRGGPKGFEKVIDYRMYYPYHFPSPYAAYLIPPDLVEGERVWLEDVIEDIVSVFGNQGYHPRLEAWEATWDGKDFEIHFNPETDAPQWIG